MRWLNNITDAAKQQINITGEGGEQISLLLYFSPRTNSWFYNIACDVQNFESNGMRLAVSPNCLRQFRNGITFGLLCVSSDGYDPSGIEDFSSGRIQIYTLSQSDVATIEEQIF